MRPFVLHAHFYQPERLNPWTGALDPEPSAAPDRDWNERIHRECYRPNAFARIFDDERRVERIVNNYERLSFNMGPTLLSWMEAEAPRTYARIIDGDWRSTVRTGHGNAMAQAYNHMILPLASDRDRRTQIAWGLADFRHRFGRDAEGMWLPETAVDRATIDALIEAGVRFTVLAPHQAARVRAPGGEWHEVGADVDAGRAYRHLHSDGSGRSIALFFYDGPLSQGLAFDRTTGQAEVLVDRIEAAADSRGGGLVHAAVDGETFGHHNPFGELGLAYALFALAEQRGLQPTTYSAWLADHPPVDEVEVVGGEGTAWSCAHGVGRWYRDCGCSTDSLPGWSQAWRTPLREALDLVRDAAAEVFTTRGGELLKDPWAARDEYIGVHLGTLSAAEFLERHALRSLREEQKADLWTLLEAQRFAMVMYTSCGWFFSDLSGIETVYVLRFAARVLDLLEEVGSPGPVDEVLEVLARARSNKPEVGNGADLWRREVAPAAVGPRRIAAHVALTALVEAAPAPVPSGPPPATSLATVLAGHDVAVGDLRRETRGRVALVTAHVRATSRATTRAQDLAVAAVHLGGLDFHGVVAPFPGDTVYERAITALWDAFPTAPVTRLLRLLGEQFSGEEFELDGILPGGRQEVVGAVFSELTSRFHEQYARLYHDHRRITEMLRGAGYELPRDLRAAAELTLATELEQRLAETASPHGAGDPHAWDEVQRILALARSQGYLLDVEPLEEALTAAVTAAAQEAATSLRAEAVETVRRWLERSGELEVDLDLSRAQEHAFEVAQKARAGRLGADEASAAAALARVVGLSPVAWGGA